MEVISAIPAPLVGARSHRLKGFYGRLDRPKDSRRTCIDVRTKRYAKKDARTAQCQCRAKSCGDRHATFADDLRVSNGPDGLPLRRGRERAGMDRLSSFSHDAARRTAADRLIPDVERRLLH